VFVIAAALVSVPLDAQQHLLIPALANATHPSDLDFQAAECDIAPNGQTMECQFQQVFLTPASFDAQTCLITTNRYALTLQKQTGLEWSTTEGPTGECGVTVVTTLKNDGGAMWAMDVRTTVTKKDGAPACRSMENATETLSWRNTRRTLPCTFVQPGAMSR
jgi:hypothetical protein